jgi:hypothetical protein
MLTCECTMTKNAVMAFANCSKAPSRSSAGDLGRYVHSKYLDIVRFK